VAEIDKGFFLHTTSFVLSVVINCLILVSYGVSQPSSTISPGDDRAILGDLVTVGHSALDPDVSITVLSIVQVVVVLMAALLSACNTSWILLVKRCVGVPDGDRAHPPAPAIFGAVGHACGASPVGCRWRLELRKRMSGLSKAGLPASMQGMLASWLQFQAEYTLATRSHKAPVAPVKQPLLMWACVGVYKFVLVLQVCVVVAVLFRLCGVGFLFFLGGGGGGCLGRRCHSPPADRPLSAYVCVL
jgi:hypothetical protein